ncbi:hypothetical protein ACOMHN_064503 [Nucella lapillus]
MGTMAECLSLGSPGFYYDSESASSASGESTVERGHAGPRGDPAKLPKNLRYDGKTNWLSFKQKFESYKSVLCWFSQESRDYLGWCLEGKALDFFTMVTQMGTDQSFHQVMKKLETRFGTVELVETVRIQFQQSSQQTDESYEDWADRVRTLATPAFRDLPEKFGLQEAIAKFCQGSLDIEAGKHAYLIRPKSMEEALGRIKQHQHISKAMGSEKKKKTKEEAQVGAVSLSDDMEKMKQTLADLLREVQSLKVKEDKIARGPPEQSTPWGSRAECYFCRRTGHFKQDCLKYRKWKENNPTGSQVTGRSGLND